VKALRAILAALALATLAGCGIPPESQAREVQPPPGPYQALASPEPANTESGTVAETLCLVKESKLVAVVRRVNRDPTVSALMHDLLGGPTEAERADGMSSALAGADQFGEVHVANGQAVVDLMSQVKDAGRSDETLSFAQVVCTLDARPGVDGVSFNADGKPIGVPRGDGSLSSAPLTMADYASLLAG
jgi:spore germination protein GerM